MTATAAMSPTRTFPIISASLDRHALGKVAGLVDIGSLEKGELVREELDHGREHEWQEREIHRLSLAGRKLQRDPVVAQALEGVVVLATDREDPGSPRLDLLEVRDRLVAPLILGR